MKAEISVDQTDNQKVIDLRALVVEEQFDGRLPVLVPKGVYFDSKILEAVNGVPIALDSPKGRMLAEMGDFPRVEELLNIAPANEPLYENLFGRKEPDLKLASVNEEPIASEVKGERPVLRVIYSREPEVVESAADYRSPTYSLETILEPPFQPVNRNYSQQRYPQGNFDYIHSLDQRLGNRVQPYYSRFSRPLGYGGVYSPRYRA